MMIEAEEEREPARIIENGRVYPKDRIRGDGVEVCITANRHPVDNASTQVD